jgi:hypothetical protein
MPAYHYPPRPHRRKHGPRGYRNVAEFRPWLRDEFSFRCVYCLEREQWVNTVGHFHGEHFLPVAARPDLELVYDNLLYACHACNSLKGRLLVPDPLEALRSKTVIVTRDGTIRGRTKHANRVIDLLQLNDPSYRRRRRFILAVVGLAEKHDRMLFLELMGFPDDLPDLSRLHPPAGNSRPNGVDKSYLALRQRGKLPVTY